MLMNQKFTLPSADYLQKLVKGDVKEAKMKCTEKDSSLLIPDTFDTTMDLVGP